MIGSEKSKEHRQRNEKICDTPRKISVLNDLKNLATRGNLEALGINLTLGIYKLAVYLWNSSNVGQENYDFFRHPRNNLQLFNSAKNAKLHAENLQTINNIH